MGLDMYLSAKRYLWSDHDKKVAEQVGEIIGVDGDPEKRFNGASLVVKEISLEALYWRKANAIHGWFVDTVQHGEDNCKEYEVERKQLEALRDLCKDILENPIATNDSDLEPREGFFFGCTNKDEWYYKDLKDTVEGLDKVLKLPHEFYFTYQASW